MSKPDITSDRNHNFNVGKGKGRSLRSLRTLTRTNYEEYIKQQTEKFAKIITTTPNEPEPNLPLPSDNEKF